MNLRTKLSASVILVLLAAVAICAENAAYPWLADYKPAEAISARIAPPDGFKRGDAAEDSFDSWLRGLPLKPGRPPVLLFDGRKKPNQEAHHAVLDLDVGTKDLQQCADSVIRLRAEFLYSRKRFADIHFNFTSGDRIDFTKWAEGWRPSVHGDKVVWAKSAAADASYKSFKNYLDAVFVYAGTASLSAELKPVKDAADLRAGDVFVHGGAPGHAVIVVDTAENPKTGEKVFLIAQGYMPAQEMHVLRNPDDAKLSPWYPAKFGEVLRIPEWVFKRDELKRW